METLRPADVASTLAELPEKRRHEVVDALDDERLADVFEELSESDQRALLAHLGDDRAADVLEAMDPDDAADLLRELPADDADRLLALMEPEESAPVRRLLHYSDDTAGGLMTPEPIVLRPGRDGRRGAGPHPQPRHPARAGQHGVRLPPAARPPRPGATWAACTPSGCCARRRSSWWRASSTPSWPRCRPTRRWPSVTRYFAAYNLVAGPVVDDEEHLLGAVTVDDVLDHLLPDDWRDRLSDNGQETRGCLRSRRGGGWTSRWSRRQTVRASTRTRSAGSPSGSPGSWAPAASSSSRPSS